MKDLKAVVVSEIKKGRFSECEFNAMFAGMRKAQNFVVYPVNKGDSTIVIQSDSRIGEVNLESGVCRISNNISGGAHFLNLPMVEENALFSKEDLESIKKLLNLDSGNGSYTLGAYISARNISGKE